MAKRTSQKGLLEVDASGAIRLPPEVAARFGLEPGARLPFTAFDDVLTLRPPVDRLRRVYLELTTLCNLSCQTCIRHVWDEPSGAMTPDTFERVVESLSALDPLPEVFVGGYGEPLFHPDALTMVKRLKALGCSVQLITNGVLLDERAREGLVEAQLDYLWVSLDGGTQETYGCVRSKTDLAGVVENLKALRALRTLRRSFVPELGVAFVAMRKNLAELPEVMRLARLLGASRLSVSNVLAHTDELWDEALYAKSLWGYGGVVDWISVPRMDLDGTVLPNLQGVIAKHGIESLSGAAARPRVDSCPFVERGSTSIRWDGRVSPCPPLLHTHQHRLGDDMRKSHEFFLGSLLEQPLAEIWSRKEYADLRERLATFDFSPCTACTPCGLAESNLEDCFGNEPPACGGCLWAQGFIQCP